MCESEPSRNFGGRRMRRISGQVSEGAEDAGDEGGRQQDRPHRA